MLKKFITVAVASALLAASITGCSGSGATTTPASDAPAASDSAAASDTTADSAAASDSAEPAQATASGDAIPLTIWGSWSGDGMAELNNEIGKFNEQTPGIVATYVLQQNPEQQLLTSIASGDVPDALIWDRFQTSLYAPKGALAPIDDYVKKDSLDMSMYYDEAVKELTNGGQLYGLPLVVDNRALFYNKGIFKEVGLDPEKPPTTWTDLEQMAVKMTKWDGTKLVRAGFALNDVGLFNTWILQAGGDMLTEDSSKTAFNGPSGLAVLNFWDELLNKSKVYQLGFTDNLTQGEDPFVTGKVAMKWDGPWAIAGLAKYASTLDYGVAALPAGPNGDKGARMGGFGVIIANGAKHADQAWTFMKWLTADPANNRDFASLTGNIPANKQAAQDPVFMNDPHYKGIVDNMQFAKIRPAVPGYSQVEGDATIPDLQLFMSGQMKAQAVLDDAQSKGDKILADNKQ